MKTFKVIGKVPPPIRRAFVDYPIRCDECMVDGKLLNVKEERGLFNATYLCPECNIHMDMMFAERRKILQKPKPWWMFRNTD